MKHLKTINELFSTPKLNLNNIREMLDYLKNYAEENGYEVYDLGVMDISSLMPEITQKRINPLDPYGEEAWELPRQKIISAGVKLFDGNDAVLGFHYTSNGEICGNELYIGHSKFENIDINLLKQLIEQ